MSDELVSRVRAFTESRGSVTGGYATGLPWLTVMRSALTTPAHHRLYRPSLCLVLQGSKEMLIGDECLTYEAMQGLIVRVDMPAAGRIADASTHEPFLGLMVDFDIGVMREVMHAIEPQTMPPSSEEIGAFVIDVEGSLADAMLRLVRLLEDPVALRVLGPSLLREISFWLLTGPHAEKVRMVAIADGRMQGVAAAIRILITDLARPVRIPELAKAAHMSSTVFHEHFKSLTSLTPLQYQKRLRLLEARRLLLDDSANAETAAFRVGYQSASQFSREYTRMFGTSPKRDTRQPSARRATSAASRPRSRGILQ